MDEKKKQAVLRGFAERLKAAMCYAGLPHEKRGSMAKIARALEVDHKAVRKWVNGDSMPDMPHGAMLSNKLGVSFNWLMADQGDMVPPESLDKEGFMVAMNWPRLTDEIRNTIKQLIRIGFKQGQNYAEKRPESS